MKSSYFWKSQSLEMVEAVQWTQGNEIKFLLEISIIGNGLNGSMNSGKWKQVTFRRLPLFHDGIWIFL